MTDHVAELAALDRVQEWLASVDQSPNAMATAVSQERASFRSAKGANRYVERMVTLADLRLVANLADGKADAL